MPGGPQEHPNMESPEAPSSLGGKASGLVEKFDSLMRQNDEPYIAQLKTDESEKIFRVTPNNNRKDNTTIIPGWDMEIKTNEDKRSAQVSIHTRGDQVTVRTVDIYYDENGDIQTDTDRFEVVDDQQLQIIMDKLEQRYVELEENYDERACAMEEEQREHRVKQAENAAKLVEQDRSEAEEILDDFA